MSWIIKALPTGVTLCALATGLTAMRFAFLGQFEYAVYSLVSSALLDGIDGHVARALHATSAFGAEMDSLCDLVDFGVSPAIVIYLWAAKVATPSAEWYASDDFVWGCCLFYAACCACRLARFNLSNEVPAPQPPHSTHFVEELDNQVKTPGGSSDSGVRKRRTRASLLSEESKQEEEEAGDPDKVDKKWLDAYANRTKFFQGVPAPAGAYIMLMPMVYTFEYGPLKVPGIPLQTLVGAIFVGVGLLMVMTARTFSSKMLIKGPVRARDPHTSHLRSRSFWTALFKISLVGLVVYLFAMAPWKLCVYIGAIYLASLPLGPIAYSFLLTDHHK